MASKFQINFEVANLRGLGRVMDGNHLLPKGLPSGVQGVIGGFDLLQTGRSY